MVSDPTTLEALRRSQSGGSNPQILAILVIPTKNLVTFVSDVLKVSDNDRFFTNLSQKNLEERRRRPFGRLRRRWLDNIKMDLK
jgi:hypothetical protein